MTKAEAASDGRVDDERRPAARGGNPGAGSGSGGERVTVNLTAKATKAMHEVSAASGDTKTDSINRALVIYAYLEEILRKGGKVYVRESEGGDLESLRFL